MVRLEVVFFLPDSSPMLFCKRVPTRLRMTFMGGSGVGKTSLLWMLAKGQLPDNTQASVPCSFTIDVEFDPVSYQPECYDVTKTTKHRAGEQNEEDKRREAFKLEVSEAFMFEDYHPLQVFNYIGPEVIALCFSVVERETFNLIKIRVSNVCSVFITIK
jgi:GTPase SAR1 family protein